MAVLLGRVPLAVKVRSVSWMIEPWLKDLALRLMKSGVKSSMKKGSSCCLMSEARSLNAVELELDRAVLNVSLVANWTLDAVLGALVTVMESTLTGSV